MPRCCKNYDTQNNQSIIPQCSLFCSSNEETPLNNIDKIINFSSRSKNNQKRSHSKGTGSRGINLTLQKNNKKQSIRTLDSVPKKSRINHENKGNIEKSVNKNLRNLKEAIINSKLDVLMERNVLLQVSMRQNPHLQKNNQERSIGLVSQNHTATNSMAKLQTIQEICGSSQYESSLCKLDRYKASASSLAIEQFRNSYPTITACKSQKISMAIIEETQMRKPQQNSKQVLKHKTQIIQLQEHARQTETILSDSQTSLLAFTSSQTKTNRSPLLNSPKPQFKQTLHYDFYRCN